MIPVNQIVSLKPTVLSPDASIATAVDLFSETKVSCIVVVAEPIRRPVGIVTERDIVRAFADSIVGINDTGAPLSSIMTEDPICLEQSTDFTEALILTRRHKIRHFPLVNAEGELVGLATQGDLLDAYADQISRIEMLESDIESLKVFALEDQLTGIGNRRAMKAELNRTASLSSRSGQSYAIALFDIDLFKKYNDHYGHQAGDRALRDVAQGIKKAIREYDTVFRYGGEEFLVLMPHAELHSAIQCAERVLSAVKALAIEHTASQFNGVITVSGGVASSSDGEWHQVIEKADKALYQSKAEGRNRVSSLRN